MQRRALDFASGFDVVAGNDDSQAALMVLGPGETVGSPSNRHMASDQWLYVVAGTGEAVVEGERVALGPGTLLLIERGEGHEICNTGAQPLETLNVYVPPEYPLHG
ncbi:MAG: cupin domain-containing protein [Gemmatimonadota bacterium]